MIEISPVDCVFFSDLMWKPGSESRLCWFLIIGFPFTLLPYRNKQMLHVFKFEHFMLPKVNFCVLKGVMHIFCMSVTCANFKMLRYNKNKLRNRLPNGNEKVDFFTLKLP